MLEFEGEKMSLARWARQLNIDKDCLRSRLRRGWSVERALTTKK